MHLNSNTNELLLNTAISINTAVIPTYTLTHISYRAITGVVFVPFQVLISGDKFFYVAV